MKRSQFEQQMQQNDGVSRLYCGDFNVGQGGVMSNANKGTTRPWYFSDDLKLFAIKAGLVAIITVFAALWIIDSVANTVRESVVYTMAELREQVQFPLGGKQFWGKIEQELDHLADASSDLPPEKKQKLINDVRLIVARWRPFIDAVQSEIQKPPNAK